LQESLWDSTSGKRLKILHGVLCRKTEKALGSIPDEEICEALIFCRQDICDEASLERMKIVIQNIKTAVSLKREEILKALTKKANSLLPDWMGEVLNSPLCK
jgi:hypothetical protein